MQRFTELKVWQRSHQFVLQVYRLTKTFPPDERDGITAQLRNAALSIPTNIAEGLKRQTYPEYARFLNIAEGSLAQTEYLLMVSRDLGYFPRATSEVVLAETDEIAKMLNALRAKIGRTP